MFSRAIGSALRGGRARSSCLSSSRFIVSPGLPPEDWEEAWKRCPCIHEGDHSKPETLPPRPQGRFEDNPEDKDEDHLYFPTLEELWPKEMPDALAPCRLERFKDELCQPGIYFPITQGACEYDVLRTVHRVQLTCAVEMFLNTATPAELRRIPPGALGPYRP